MPNKTLKNVQIVDDDFSELRPLLNNWIAIVEEYSEFHDWEDACYWYNERATLSTLAAAAWRTKGWCALEEYQTNKRRRMRMGRCDLYIASKEFGYECEAKQSWQKFEEGLDWLKKKVRSAKQAAGDLVPSNSDKRLALTFWSPSFPNECTDEDINKWLNGLSTFKKSVALAWIFPKETRNLESDNERKYPGVVLLVHEIKRSPK